MQVRRLGKVLGPSFLLSILQRIKQLSLTKACKHSTNTPSTFCEQFLTLLGSIETTDPLLQAHIAQINVDVDPNGKGGDFEETATHLMMLADPIEKHKSKHTGKKVTISSSLVERGSTGVDLRWYWYPNNDLRSCQMTRRKG